MKLRIIGAGNVGSTLGRGWADRGHSVVFGVRNAGGERARALAHGHGPDIACKQAAPQTRWGG